MASRRSAGGVRTAAAWHVAGSKAESVGLVVACLLCACESAQDATTVGGGGSANGGASNGGTAGEGRADAGADAGAAYAACRAGSGVPFDLEEQSQAGADAFAWGSLLAYVGSGGEPAWTSWSSSVDLINCHQSVDPQTGTCTAGQYVPAACAALAADAGAGNLDVIDQVSKINDSFLEAESEGLSSDPVIAKNGTFLRYQILISPETQDYIVSESLQEPATLQASRSAVSFPCSDAGVPGENQRSTVLKLAWMEAAGLGASELERYYTRRALVFTDGSLTADGNPTCEEKTVALVGLHLLRKTASQRAWVWGTFEQAQNAPDCTGDLPATQSGQVATSCPSVSQDWNFHPTACNDAGACQTCNARPCSNAGDAGCDADEWRPNQPPAADRGLSRLCRQVRPGEYYAGATSWDETPPNRACQPDAGPWSNYQLISTQWAVEALGTGCSNVQRRIDGDAGVQHQLIAPKITVPAGSSGSAQRPFLGNTSMESYERSNCMGCHSKSTVTLADGGVGVGTDFVYFLKLEVPGAPQ